MVKLICVFCDCTNTPKVRWNLVLCTHTHTHKHELAQLGTAKICVAVAQDPIVSYFSGFLSQKTFLTLPNNFSARSRIHCFSYREKVTLHHTKALEKSHQHELLRFCGLWFCLPVCHVTVQFRG